MDDIMIALRWIHIAAGMIVLLAILLLLNAVAIWLRNKYEKKW